MMNPAISTIERKHINVLAWPIFGGYMAWCSFEEGVNMRLGAEDQQTLQGRIKEGLQMMFEWLDQHHEDDEERLAKYRRCFPMREYPVKIIPLPAAPPYLESGVLDHCVEEAYSKNHPDL